MSNEDNGDERLGYCRPPAKHRFQKGKSGNPKGRPKKSKNFATIVDKALDAEGFIVEGDKRRRVSKRGALGLNLVGKGLVLHPRALPPLMQHIQRQDDKLEEKQAQEQSQGLVDDDEDLMRRFFPSTEPEENNG